MPDPVDSGVCGMEPGESKDDIFLLTTHDVKEMFLGNPFNIGIEDADIANYACFVGSLVYIVNSDGEGEFFSGESVFPDKLPVNARDVGTRVY